jgi:hypothetical protein
LQSVIVRGRMETMLTALKCGSELDSGPVYLRQPMSLTELARVCDFICMLDAEGYPQGFAEIGHLRLEFGAADSGAEFVEANVRNWRWRKPSPSAGR